MDGWERVDVERSERLRQGRVDRKTMGKSIRQAQVGR